MWRSTASLWSGERINPTGKKRLQQALRDGDSAYPCTQAVAQAEAGAQVLDVNAGLPGIDEAATLEQLVKDLQAVTDLPLQLDSSNPEALSRALRIYNGKPIVNSVNGEPETLENDSAALQKGTAPPSSAWRWTREVSRRQPRAALRLLNALSPLPTPPVSRMRTSTLTA